MGWIAWKARLSALKTSVAHELNNPLTAIWGVSQILASRDLGGPETKEVTLIMKEAERMSRIVQNLLSFARAGNSDKSVTSINAAINSAVELRQYHLMVNNVVVDLRLDETLPKTKADPHKIQQVALNLISNAEHAMLQTNNGGRLIIETKREGETIVLRVTDDGPGMSKEQMANIFDPFFTTKSAGDGTGLGLAISETIVREHNGFIDVESEQGMGTTFTILLPIVGEDVHSRFKQPSRPMVSLVLPVQEEDLPEDDVPVWDLMRRAG